jgi:hypothetical protein
MAGFETAPPDLKPLLSQRINELGLKRWPPPAADVIGAHHQTLCQPVGHDRDQARHLVRAG